MKLLKKSNTNLGFWDKLNKPFFGLAPMSDITDSPFRQIVAKRGKPDVFFTGFISADGLCSEGKKNLLRNLTFTDLERPIVCQLFGAKPENFYRSAKLIKKFGFDGIDINMGCPYREVEKQGAGAALILNPKLAQEIILATKKGAPNLPVSVKTRLGYNTNNIDQWTKELLKAKPAIITIHGRTRKEKSKVPADWKAIGEATKIIKKSGKNSLIIGNGDVKSLEEAKNKAKKYKVDGVMIGRAVLNNPWFFSGRKEITLKEKLLTLKEHAFLFERTFGQTKNFFALRKFFSSYVNEFFEAKKLRLKLMTATNSQQLAQIIDNFLKASDV